MLDSPFFPPELRNAGVSIETAHLRHHFLDVEVDTTKCYADEIKSVVSSTDVDDLNIESCSFDMDFSAASAILQF